MSHGRRPWLAGVLLVGALLAGCGGDDEGGGSDAEFCAAVEQVRTSTNELSKVELRTDADVPAVKERVVALIDAFQAVVETAPDAIREEADEAGSLVAQVEARVADATTAAELRQEVPLLVNVLVESGDRDGRLSQPITEYVAEHCGITAGG